MKVSIIIPVYNSEKYLNKCLDSIVNQTFNLNEVEIIIINDGSKDQSETIIKSYQEKLNIIYLKQENKGQSAARNLGIKKASGTYLTFIDSDDYISPNMLKKLYTNTNNEYYDIVTCNINKVKDNNIYPIYEELSTDTIKNYILTKAGCCNMLLKRTFLNKNNFLFPEFLHKYEDIATVPSLAFKQNVKINQLKEPLYYYNDTDNSVMNSPEYTPAFNDIFKALDYLLTTSKKDNSYEKYYPEIEYIFIRHLVMNAGLNYLRFNDPENEVSHINSFMKENFPNWRKNLYLKKAPFKYKITTLIVTKKLKIILKIIDKIRRKS